MKRTTAFRITADLCFYFSILNIFPALRPWQLPMLLFTAAAFLVTLLAVYCPYAPLRFLLSLLPGLCFLLAPLDFLLFFPGLAWIYLILMLSFGRFGMFLDDYRRIYRSDFTPIEELLKEYEKDGWTKRVSDSRWCFTPTGFLLSNVLIGSLLEAQAEHRIRANPWLEESAVRDLGRLELPSDREIY